MTFWLFALGAAFGSFLNVLALRYTGEEFILSSQIIRGRSHCAKCGRTLKWFELVPVISFAIQKGRCRACHEKISPQHPIVEIASGLIFVFVAKFFLGVPGLGSATAIFLAAAWICIFLTLLLLSIIDIRLRIIPDEANAFLAVLGIVIAAIGVRNPHSIPDSFLGHYAFLFGGWEAPFLNRVLAVVVAAGFFAFLVAATKGKGMGMGDVKLAAALGVIFGWPDIVLLAALSFVLGSLFGGALILLGKKKMKSFLPFGPFLALAALLVFFFGNATLDAYFGLFSI